MNQAYTLESEADQSTDKIAVARFTTPRLLWFRIYVVAKKRRLFLCK